MSTNGLETPLIILECGSGVGAANESSSCLLIFFDTEVVAYKRDYVPFLMQAKPAYWLFV